MRAKLQKFTRFANSLLPHETEYLLSIQQFEDTDKYSILLRIDQNCRRIDQFSPYDVDIDKRKYSHLKNWIKKRLKSIDVDENFDWMSHLERQITIDAITPGEEKKLLKAIRQYEHPLFFFTKFYELLRHYRQFLLIRMRYDDHSLVDQFLEQYEQAYRKSRSVNEEIHRATLDIVRQYSENNAESKQWERWLTGVFYDEELDGLNRYQALIRLIFIGLNYRKFDTLLEKFDYIDELFKQGQYYSKRLLLNYYSNRLLLHTKFQQLEKASYYGYLSIRGKNHDYILYVNNLCAVLLRRKKYEEALSLMNEAAPEMKNTKNFHNRIGFVAFYAKSLNENGLYKNAENYAESFLIAYRREVFKYRWHIFFTTYLEALLYQRKFMKVMRVIRKNNLIERDRKYRDRAVYLPTIAWYYLIAQYKEGEVLWQDLEEALVEDIIQLSRHPDKRFLLVDIFRQLQTFLGDKYLVLRAKVDRKAGNVSALFGS
ncbi:MAG: hypothetical protein R3350_02835 [Saprospiraceae bacterium]|nr:hypothetical protein [Saprospiraceae bacterium]